MKRKYKGVKIPHKKRLAIYARDNYACIICKYSNSNDKQLSLDHIIPHSQGGNMKTTNLLTLCRFHNMERNTLSIEEYINTKIDNKRQAKGILRKITRQLHKPINTIKAQNDLEFYGSYNAALMCLVP